MNKSNIILTGLLTTVLLASGNALAERPRQGGQFGQPSNTNSLGSFMPKGPAFKHAQMAFKLQLTTEQRDEIREIHLAAEESKRTLFDPLILNREQIKTLTKTSPYDENQVQLLAATQGELISQLIVIRANTKASVFAVLTEEKKILLEKEKSDKKG